MIKIIENWIDPVLSDLVKEKLIYDTPHYYGEVSSKGLSQTPFYATRLDYNWTIEYLHRKIQLEVFQKPLNLQEAYINVQYPGMDGVMHVDHSPITALYMVSDSVDNGSEFEFIDENKNLTQVKFKQNTLIIFDQKFEHRGIAPIEAKPRVTLAFKLEDINAV